MLLAALLACAPLDTSIDAPADPCALGDGEGAVSTCLSPTQTDAYYADQGLRYFDTLETGFSGDGGPTYDAWVARWEWPPWLKLTGYGAEDMETVDAIIRLLPTTVPERDCRTFATQPFARCRVSFLYEEHPDQPCPIYEEFTFDNAGEITFIEAWTDTADLRPSADADDLWAEGDEVHRLSTKLPGLGNAEGQIDLDSPWMQDAAAADPDVADFVVRAKDFYGMWLEAYEAAGPDVFVEGCSG